MALWGTVLLMSVSTQFMFDNFTAQMTFGLFSAFTFGGALYFWLQMKDISGLTKD